MRHERGGARYEHRKDRIDPGPSTDRAPLSGERTSAILAVDPATGLVRRVGQLARPLSDAAVAAAVNRVIVVGGETPAGRAVLDARAERRESTAPGSGAHGIGLLAAALLATGCGGKAHARHAAVPYAPPAQAVTRDLSSREDHRRPDHAVEERRS